MIESKALLISALTAVLMTTGCAAYRVDSNIPSEAPAPRPASGVFTEAPPVVDQNVIPRSEITSESKSKVLISEDALSDRKHKKVGPIEVSVKKLTIFHKDPTREQADDALREKAVAIGADAVIYVTYESGIGFTSWGHMDAKGIGVKLEE